MGFLQDALDGVGNFLSPGQPQTAASTGNPLAQSQEQGTLAKQREAVDPVLRDYGWNDTKINGFWALDDATQQRTFAALVQKSKPVDTTNTKQYLASKGYAEEALAGLTPESLSTLTRDTLLKAGKTPLFNRETANTTLKGSGVQDADLAGMSDATVQHLVQTMYDQKLKAKKTGQPIDRQALANAAPPEVRDLILNSPESALPNVISSIAAAKMRAPAQTKPTFDRNAAISRIDPRYREQAKGLSDDQLSSELSREIQASQKTQQSRSGIKYIPGASLKIVQDEQFARSGLKSGDTVCIKIP